MIKVKICGVTNLEDAKMAAEAGADAIGLNFVEGYPRCIQWETGREITHHLPPFFAAVGVFADSHLDEVRTAIRHCRLTAVQLHGDESPEYCRELAGSPTHPIRVIKVFRIRDRETLDQIPAYLNNTPVTPLLDAYHADILGGTGQSFDWELALEAKAFGPFILSGGLNPDNVAEAVRRLSPYGVDVSSGVEAELCKKDPEKVHSFVQQARAAGVSC